MWLGGLDHRDCIGPSIDQPLTCEQLIISLNGFGNSGTVLDSGLPQDINFDFSAFEMKTRGREASLQPYYILTASPVMFLKHDEYTEAELPATLIIDTVLCATRS